LEKKLCNLINNFKKESEKTRPEINKTYQSAISTLTETHSIIKEISNLNEQLYKSTILLKKQKSVTIEIEKELHSKIENESDIDMLMVSLKTFIIMINYTETNLDTLKTIFKIRGPLKEILRIIVDKGDGKKTEQALESQISQIKTGLGLIPIVGAPLAVLIEMVNQYSIYNNKAIQKASSRLDEVERLSTLLNSWNMFTEAWLKGVKETYEELQVTVSKIGDDQEDFKKTIVNYPIKQS
jgi:chromosome segregation ATPase